MKKKLLLILMMMITVFATGCNKISENEAFVQAQTKLESHQYNEALTLLSEVLNEDPNNSSARSMYMQARKMHSAEEYENNQDYIKSIRELETIVNINDGSKQIKREAINKKSELEKLQAEKSQQALERKENAKKTAKEENSKRKYETPNINNEEEKTTEEIKEEEIKVETIEEVIINQEEPTDTEVKIDTNEDDQLNTHNIEQLN